MKFVEDIDVVIEGGFQEFPQIMMHRVKQNFPRPVIEDIEGTVRAELAREEIRKRIKPGMNVAVCVGSRGVAQIPLLTKTVISVLKEYNAKPFIVPAMGSHGGAKAEGQKLILEHLGVTEEAMGAEIHSSMEVVSLGDTHTGQPVYMDKNAYEADLVILIPRVKVHTDIKGPFESGIMKMLTIGLGKHKGTSFYHRFNPYGNMHNVIPVVGQHVIDHSNVAFALAVVENAYGELAVIKAIPAEKVLEEEPKLLEISKQLMPRIEVDDVDVLIIDEMGKEVSGTGMDPNIMGRASAPDIDPSQFKAPKIKRIVTLDLTEGSEGNAAGVGLADIIPKRLFEKVSLNHTYANCITGTLLKAAYLPIITETDYQAFVVGVKTCTGMRDYKDAKVVRIKNTNEIYEIQVSTTLLDQVRKRPHCEISSGSEPITFDEKGNMLPYGAK